MESATIAANGFRFGCPTVRCYASATSRCTARSSCPAWPITFYRERVDQHLRIGMRAVELLRQERPGSLHSRKLRSFAEVAFQ
jgi:AMP nucleosidase